MLKRLKLAFLAPSGYGKSTSSMYLEKKHSAKIVKLAKPLYEIQKLIYDRVNIDIVGQDGDLLQFLGNKIQTISPKYLFNEFIKEVNSLDAELIVNDDCRPHNYEYLKAEGFIFVKIESFSRERNEDTTSHDSKSKVEWNPDMIPFDFCITNKGTINDLNMELDSLLEKISKA